MKLFLTAEQPTLARNNPMQTTNQATILRFRCAGDSEVRTIRYNSADDANHFTVDWLLAGTDWHEWINDAKEEARIIQQEEWVRKNSFASSLVKPMSKSAPAPIQTIQRRDEDKFNIPLLCARSGLNLGKFVPSSGLKSTPYVKAWKDATFLHPVFSLELPSLISRAQACWQLEKAGIRQYPMKEKQLIFLAMLHASGCIKQDYAGLPSPKVVETCFPRLIELLGWKHETASDRVQFPKLHIYRHRAEASDIGLFSTTSSWLDLAEACKDDYENTAKVRQREAKKKAQELALKNIRRQMYSDISLKRLWNWFATQVPQMILENNSDLEQLWYTEEARIQVWTVEDIEALEGLFLKHCELGNSVSHEFNKRIAQLNDWLRIYNDTFEIVESPKVQFPEWVGVPEPMLLHFGGNRAQWLVARARWQLANKPTNVAKVPNNGTKITGDDL